MHPQLIPSKLQNQAKFSICLHLNTSSEIFHVVDLTYNCFSYSFAYVIIHRLFPLLADTKSQLQCQILMNFWRAHQPTFLHLCGMNGEKQ
jgi:hypothetical protein